MPKSTRQKYSFLIGWMRQLEEAADEGDEEYAEFRRIAESLFPSGGADGEELADRLAKCEQWLAQLEAAVDSLEQAYGEDDGSDDDEPDGSDEDADMERHGPQVGGRVQRDDRQPGPVARAAEPSPVAKRRHRGA